MESVVFVTYNASSHKGAIEMFWPDFKGKWDTLGKGTSILFGIDLVCFESF